MKTREKETMEFNCDGVDREIWR